MIELHQIVGLFGTTFVVGSYLALQMRWISGHRIGYPLLNAIGAAMIVFSLLFEFNFSAMTVEVFWVVISVIGISKCLRSRKPDNQSS